MNKPTGASDFTLEITRTFDATVSDLYRAFTSEDQLRRWWGPEGTRVIDCQLDLAIDGAWSITIAGEQQQRHVSGRFVRIEPQLIAFTWSWQHDPKDTPETLVTIRFEAVSEHQSQLHLTQTLFAETVHRDNHNGGWRSSFNKLEQWLASDRGETQH